MKSADLMLAIGSKFEERLRAIRGGFNDRPTDPADIWAVIYMLVIPISAMVLFFAIRQYRQKRREIANAPAHPMRLFDNVLRRMGVGMSDRYLMRAFARSANLPQPTIVLFSRDLFEKSTTRWLNSLSVKAIQTHATARFSAIAEMAFGPQNENDQSRPGGRPPLPENPFEMRPSTVENLLDSSISSSRSAGAV